MGEVNVSPKEQSPKRKILSTRVDLTPMVDLGFLLITFFIFTTKMGEPKSMKLTLPKDTITDSMKTPVSKTVNFILTGEDMLAYYQGDSIQTIIKLDYGSGIRKAIQDKKQAIRNHGDKPEDMVVLIKPTKESSYKNIVDLLDEMTINQVKTYILMEPSDEEIKKAADLRVRS